MGKKKGLSYKQRKKERIQYLINEEKKEEEVKEIRRAKRKVRQMDIDDLDVAMFSSRKKRKFGTESSNKITQVNKPKKVSEIMEVDVKSSEPKPKSVVISLGFEEAKEQKELIEETKGKTMKRKRSNSIKQGKFMSHIGSMELD